MELSEVAGGYWASLQGTIAQSPSEEVTHRRHTEYAATWHACHLRTPQVFMHVCVRALGGNVYRGVNSWFPQLSKHTGALAYGAEGLYWLTCDDTM